MVGNRIAEVVEWAGGGYPWMALSSGIAKRACMVPFKKTKKWIPVALSLERKTVFVGKCSLWNGVIPCEPYF